MSQPTVELPTATGGPDQAEAWLARLLSPDCTREERAAFEAWLARSPEHIEAYLQAETVHAMAAALADDAMLRAAARRARREAAQRGGTRWGWLATGMAAALALVAGGALWFGRAPEGTATRYATAVGEQRTLVLEDGSHLRLDTDTEVVARYGTRARELELLRGRLQVAVGADPRRPFSVRAGEATVRDIGTTFQVSRDGTRTSVGLIEGVVVVSARGGGAPATLAPGERIEIDERGRLGAPQQLDLASAEAWTRGELVFRQRRLDALLAEVNRYSATPLRLADPALGALTVSGVFRIDEQAALVAALEQGWSLRAERGPDGAIVLHRR
ncbi:MAG TPA: FecR domain-containing protein [Lysobacter sp.]|nr:FecR domain-containing protein [Lysobacter sp.]